MKIIKYGFVLLISLVMSSTGFADYKYRTSVGAVIGSYKLIDPEGKTNSESFFIPVNLKSELYLNKIQRFVGGIRPLDFTIDAESGAMGATIKGFQFDAQWQYKFRLNRYFKPWIGGGVRTSVYETKDRLTVDEDNFLLEEFNDRNDTNFSAIFSANTEWKITKNWFIEATTEYDIPFSDGLEGFGFGVGVKYNFDD